MADRKAINKYYPPDWDPSKGSLNQYKNSHPLRARARKLDQGILVIRFAMPFNIWCLGCNNHVGKGVRYNAEKSRVGSYYDTPIYEFKMKCRLCDNFYILRTDPANLDYCIESGARRQARQEFLDEIDQIEAAKLAEEARKQIPDPMLRLEKRAEDKTRVETSQPSLLDLKKWRSRWEDSFSMNQLVRAQFRKRREKIEQSKERDKKLLKKSSLKIALCTPTQSVRREAKRIVREAGEGKVRNSETQKRKDLLYTDRFVNRDDLTRPSSSATRAGADQIKKEL